VKSIITTGDGSHTIYVPELNEHYHSVHGAVQESEHIFIKNGYRAFSGEKIRIFEVGFGTGLNCLLTASECLRDKRDVTYTTIEKFPLGENTLESLNHFRYLDMDYEESLRQVYKAAWNKPVRIFTNLLLHKIEGDLTADDINGEYDLIYFDAFGPDKQPEMWTRDIFRKISLLTASNGIFVTYSAKGEVKRNLRNFGFRVELLPGPPGKREMIRAVKI